MAAEAGAVTLESSTDFPLNDTSIDFVCFTVGERFCSYLHLKEKVAAYEKAKSNLQKLIETYSLLLHQSFLCVWW